MNIEINDAKTVYQLQEEFSERFPYLRLEFFEMKNAEMEYSEETRCAEDRRIGQIRTLHNEGTILIHPGNSIAAIEQEFEEEFGLHIKIFRLQADHWLQIPAEEESSLTELNEKAKADALFYNPDHQITAHEFLK